jgi:hypothetical protein
LTILAQRVLSRNVAGIASFERLGRWLSLLALAAALVAIALLSPARVPVSPVRPLPTGTARPDRSLSPVTPRAGPPALDTALQIRVQGQNLDRLPLYHKFEVTFAVDGTSATNPDFPYDPNPPPGLPGRIGMTVEGLFLPPGASDWNQALVQPAFPYQGFERITSGEAEGLYPTGQPVWKLRFAPTLTGAWQFKIRAQDASICPDSGAACANWIESQPGAFSVTAVLAGEHGFVRVSQSDARYFEFSDGTPFLGLGHQMSFGSNTQVEGIFDLYKANGVNLLRSWMSSTGVYSLGFWFWDTWSNSSLVFGPTYPGHDVAARIVGVGDSPCIFHGFGEGALSVLKGKRTYRIEIRARLEDVKGPRQAGQPYGLVAKFGTWPKGICGNPGNGLTTLSAYWNDSQDWTVYSSTFTLPEDVIVGWDGYLTIALENTLGGTAYIDEVRVIEEPNGPNVLVRGNMNYHLYFDQASSWRWDYILDRAAERGVFLKLVILEKQDGILSYIRPDGTIAAEADDNNFYGVNPDDPGRPTKVRRLEEYFWRYLSARWGYSTAVHSWELLNEGDPYNGNHYDQANALGRVIRETDPNHHLVSTSFWHSFPVQEFWANGNYPYVDYADIHAYVDTTWLRAPDNILDASVRQRCGASQDCYLNAMKNDAALYHSEHSLNTWLERPGKPVVRGEAGLTLPGTVQEPDPGLMKDKQGVWLHNYLFAQVDAGGMTDLYWFTCTRFSEAFAALCRAFR